MAERQGVEQGLALLDGLELDDYRYFHSTRADLLRRLGRKAEATTAHARAFELSESDAERRFLERRLEDLRAPDSDSSAS